MRRSVKEWLNGLRAGLQLQKVSTRHTLAEPALSGGPPFRISGGLTNCSDNAQISPNDGFPLPQAKQISRGSQNMFTAYLKSSAMD